MDTNSKLSNNTAIILVSHGSTLPYGEATFTEIKEKFIDATGNEIKPKQVEKHQIILI